MKTIKAIWYYLTHNGHHDKTGIQLIKEYRRS